MRRRDEWAPLKLVEGETYALCVPGALTLEQAERIKAQFQQANMKAIILAGGMTIARERRPWWRRWAAGKAN